jgi:hypothetical protein
MQQFVVPQFIDVEDKILGPITVRQFLIMLVGGMTLVVAFRFADFAIFAVLALIIGGITLTFAFVKVNGQTFHYFLLNLLQTWRKPSTRIWKKQYSQDELEYLRKKNANIEYTKTEKKKPVHRQRIRDLALIVNTGGYYRPDEP